jgi:hypothetical protein
VARVVVNGRYVYESELDLEIGDEILLPAGFSGDWVGRVTALSSDYPGSCKRIVGLVRRRSAIERRSAALASVAITGFRTGTTLEITASCGHQVRLHIEAVNRAGRPTYVKYACEACGGIPCSGGLGSADAWRRLASGID